MPRFLANRFVEFCGLATSLLTAILVVAVEDWLNFSFFTLTFWVVIPVGALITGCFAATGYYFGAILANRRPTKQPLVSMVAVAGGTFFLIYYLQYISLDIDGKPVRDYVTFSTYLQVVLTKAEYGLMRSQNAKFEVGAFGYVIAALQLVAFMLGGFGSYLALTSKPFCDRCEKYLKTLSSLKKTFADQPVFESFATRLHSLSPPSAEYLHILKEPTSCRETQARGGSTRVVSAGLPGLQGSTRHGVHKGDESKEGVVGSACKLTLVLALLLLLSCPLTKTPSLPPGPDDPLKILAQHDGFGHVVQREAMVAAWRSATEHSNVAPKSFGVKPLLLLTDAEVRALNGRLSEAQQRLCLRAIHSLAVRMQSESDLGVMTALARIAPLRQQIPDLSQMFTDEANVTRRREQWFSQADIAARLAPLVRQLAAARKAWAWRRSRLAYLELMKRHRGYDPEIAEGLENEVRRALGSDDVPQSFPWGFEFIDPPLSARMTRRFDEAHCLNRASFILVHLGLPANPPALQVRDPKQVVFSSFAFYPIDPPADQGITVRPGAGIVPHWSAFHEFGHAAMSLLVVPGPCRTFSHPVSPAVSESCAKIAERLFYSEEWLQSQGVPSGEIESLQEWERQSELTRMRSILADIEFERVLYRDPGGDVMSEYIAIQNRTAGVEMSKDFPAWSLKRHLAFEPLARVDYLLARCAQAAVYRRLRQQPGGLLGDPARQLLRDQVFRDASGSRFEDWFRRAAGTEPNCSAWLQDVAKKN
jgi:hypothetical protein